MQDHQINKLVRVFTRMHHTCLRCAFEQRGMGDVSNPQILFCLSHLGAVTQKEIADETGLSAPTVAVSVKRMEKKGLLNKVMDEADMRKNRITLTDKAKAMLEKCKEADVRILESILEGFSDEEVQQMSGYFLRMIRNMELMQVRIPTEFGEEKTV